MIVRGPRGWAYSDSRPANMPFSRHATNEIYQTVLSQATLEAVSNRSVKQEENCNVWYILNTKSGKNRYFLGVGERHRAKPPLSKRPKDVSRGKIDL